MQKYPAGNRLLTCHASGRRRFNAAGQVGLAAALADFLRNPNLDTLTSTHTPYLSKACFPPCRERSLSGAGGPGGRAGRLFREPKVPPEARVLPGGRAAPPCSRCFAGGAAGWLRCSRQNRVQADRRLGAVVGRAEGCHQGRV